MIHKTVTRWASPLGEHESKDEAQAALEAHAAEQRRVYARALARAHLERAELRRLADEGEELGGSTDELVPLPDPPARQDLVAVHYREVHEVHSTRDGERVVAGLDKATAFSEAERLAAEYVERHHAELNSEYEVDGPEGPVSVRQHLELASVRRYEVRTRLERLPAEAS